MSASRENRAFGTVSGFPIDEIGHESHTIVVPVSDDGSSLSGVQYMVPRGGTPGRRVAGPPHGGENRRNSALYEAIAVAASMVEASAISRGDATTNTGRSATTTAPWNNRDRDRFQWITYGPLVSGQF